jgi:hypothetical protein
VTFTLENRTGDRHTTVVAMAPPRGTGRWELRVDGRRVEFKPNSSTDYPLHAEIPMGPAPARVQVIRR